MRIAVIGSGIAGLAAAWLLSRRGAVVLYEAEPRLGGHANTVDVPLAGGTIPVDTGFLVYNEVNYPNLVRLFDHLGVETAPSDMSFAVSLDGGAFEYGVITAANGAEALDVLRSDEIIDLLFTDIVMPGGMNGRKLANQARSIRPGLPVLFTSGYTENAIVHHGRLDPDVHLLQKPYRRQQLAAKLRQVLRDKGALRA